MKKQKIQKKPIAQPQTEARDYGVRWLPHLLSITLIIIISIIIYSNTLQNGFVFDDLTNIVENHRIKDLSNFYDLSGTRYIGFLSFALNYHFGGLNVFGYHLVNILIHILNGLLVFHFVALTLKTPAMERITLNSQSSIFNLQSSFIIPLTAALIFVSHPVQTQAVIYIVQRFTSLATLFYLSATVCYLKWRISPVESKNRYLWYGGSLFLTIFAMKTKEISLTLPFMILLIEVIFFKGFDRKKWFFLIPFLLTLLIIPLSRLDAGTSEKVGFGQETAGIGRLDYLLTQFRVIVTYVRLLFLPIDQNLDYDYPLSQSLFEPYTTFISFLFLLGLFVFAIYLFLRSRKTEKSPSPILGEDRGEGKGFLLLISFGIFWFFITLSVESSIIPIRDVINEHRVYLPSIGAAIAFTAAVFYAFDHWKVKNIIVTAIVLLITMTIPLGIATYIRNFVWKDGLSLWSDVVNKSPDKYRGHYNLGNAYYKQVRMDEAIKEYLTALKIKPEFADAHYNLGNAYYKQVRMDEAIKEYLTALKIKPHYIEAHNNLGNAYANQGRMDEAIKEFQITLKHKPDLAETHFNLGIAYKEKGLKDEAIKEFKEVLKLNPQDREAQYLIQTLLAK